MTKLLNKVAIVTGAATGMGKSIAELYAKEGAKVVIADFNLEGAKSVADSINASGGDALAVFVNVASQSDIDNLFDETLSKYGKVDVLVNNAGVMDDFAPAADTSDEVWEKVMSINSMGPFRTTRRALPLFLEQGSGVIVNLASVGGLHGYRAGAAYTASKHAVVGLTKNTAFGYADKNIRCNAIAPGGVATTITSNINPHDEGMKKAISGAQNNPAVGQPEQIAKVALFLASDDSDFVNGQVVVADAGWTAY